VQACPVFPDSLRASSRMKDKKPQPPGIPPLPIEAFSDTTTPVWYEAENAVYYFAGIGAVAVILVLIAFSVAVTPNNKASVHDFRKIPLVETFEVNDAMPVLSDHSKAILSLEALIEKYEGAVVTVYTNGGSLGSGFVVKGRNLVVTNYHVIDGATGVWIETADHQQVKTSGFAALAPERDLALLNCNVSNSDFGLEIEGKTPKRGDRVVAWGSSEGLQGTVSDGIVSGIRVLNELGQDDNLDPSTKLIQTTAPISHGNSGGPLMNLHGKVIGVNSFIHAVGQNLNFAVSAEHLIELLGEKSSFSHSPANIP
jgi:S1-C subfamily serine protease